MKAEKARNAIKRNKGKQGKEEYKNLIRRIKEFSKYGFGKIYCPILYPENVEKLKSLGYEVSYDEGSVTHRYLGHLIEWSKEK